MFALRREREEDERVYVMGRRRVKNNTSEHIRNNMRFMSSNICVDK